MSQPTWPVNIPDSNRGTKKISSGLDKKLLAYANAAAAAGVGVLALSQSAAAEIKFTRVNETSMATALTTSGSSPLERPIAKAFAPPTRPGVSTTKRHLVLTTQNSPSTAL